MVMLLLITAAAVLTSCATSGERVGESKGKVQQKLKTGEWGGPESNAVLFGSEYKNCVILQQNPKLGYQFYQAQAIGSASEVISLFGTSKADASFFIQPLPVGSELKMYASETDKGDKNLIMYEGISGVDVKLTKPGLVYYDLNDSEHKNEKEALKTIQPYFKGTSWEPVIAKRIEELKK